MTGAEHDQLRVWGKYDGWYLGGIWAVGFIALMNSALVPMLSVINEVIILASPFYILWRLRRFRDQGRNGVITYGWAFFFLAWMEMNALIIFGFTQFFYLSSCDDGQLAQIIAPMINTPEYAQALQQMGMTTEQYLEQVASITPLSFASSCFLVNIVMCIFVDVIIAGICARKPSCAQPLH